MKKIILFSFFLLNSCSFSPVKTHFKSDRFIDIEFEKDDFFMRCSILDNKKKKSLMTFYGVNGETVYEFFFRRVSEDGSCEKLALKDYKRLVEKSSRVRIVGIMPLDRQENDLLNDSLPENLKKPKYIQNWTFVRLQTSSRCRAYFDVDCEDDNYWAGLLPQR